MSGASKQVSGASEQLSGESEQANGRASGPVLQSVFLAVLDHSVHLKCVLRRRGNHRRMKR